MTDYRLVTYQCLHFKIIAEHATITKEKKDSTNEGLSSKPTTSQRHSKFRCGSPECEDITQEEWLSRINDALDHCKQYFSTSTELYFDAAHGYHSTSLCVRAMMLKDSACGAVHWQYGIERRNWDDDPFFETWQDAVETVYSVEQELARGVSEESLADAVTAVNLVRALVSRVEGELGKVIDGAFAVQNKQRELELKGDLVVVSRRGARRAYFPPMDMFARTVYEKWAKRMEGFRQAFHSE